MMSTMRDIARASAVDAVRSETFARHHPVLVYAVHVFRAAAVMSLALILADAFGWAVMDVDPLRRLTFVLFWAAGVSVFSVLDVRFGGFRLLTQWLARRTRR